ncbi:hypothetical protein FB451DRAFT_1360184 [Mycena latifolia]|nr:hypothetical protein FB451DRAFT_1360184 [Mycena latifolia]
MSRAPVVSALQQYTAEYVDALAAETDALGALRRQLQATRAQLDAAAIASASANAPMARVTIFCGSEQPFTTADFNEFLPSLMSLGLDGPLPQPGSQKPLKSSGCGTQIHSAALPIHTQRIWTGEIDGLAAIVVPLEAKYVPPEMAASMIGPTRDACGCGCEYVGCAVCGNALGLSFTPCPTHLSATRPVVYSLLSSSVSPPLPSAPPTQVATPLPMPPPPPDIRRFFPPPPIPQSLSVPSIAASTDTPRPDAPSLGPRPMRTRREWPPRTPLLELHPLDPRPAPTDPRSLLVDMLQHAATLSRRVDELNYDVIGLVNGVRVQSELLASLPGAPDAAGVAIVHPADTVVRGPLPAGATTRVLRVGAGLPTDGGVDADLPWDVTFG